MKKFLTSLPAKLLLGIVLGIIIGQMALPESVLVVIVTLKYLMGQVITFCVPLIVIGFIAPSITKLGSSASRMLGIALVLAYVSSIGAAFFSAAAGYAIIPSLNIVTTVEGLKALPPVAFELAIPQIMSVMSALVFSVLIGLAATWSKAKTISQVLAEFQEIVLQIVTKIVIPILPFFIATTFCGLS
ncbi:MAG: dicarboxylate/amino acid:cation symporter, partial [Angelakisella sp.]